MSVCVMVARQRQQKNQLQVSMMMGRQLHRKTLHQLHRLRQRQVQRQQHKPTTTHQTTETMLTAIGTAGSPTSHWQPAAGLEHPGCSKTTPSCNHLFHRHALCICSDCTTDSDPIPIAMLLQLCSTTNSLLLKMRRMAHHATGKTTTSSTVFESIVATC